MPYAMLTCCLGVFLGGLMGWGLRRWIGQGLRELLPILFGLTAISNGVLSVIRAAQMPVVTLAVLLGGVVGHQLRLEERVRGGFAALVERVPHPADFDLEQYITVVAVFCASGFGLYAVMVESFSGDRGQMFSKAILDFSAAVIFGSSMGISVSLVAVPQLAVFTLFFFLAKALMPVMTGDMLLNFVACGGVMTIAAGMRMAKIKAYPLIDMLPALALVLPLTPLWSALA